MGSGDLKIWDLENLQVVICGIPITGGYGDGECLHWEWDEKDFLKKKGADGEVTRSKSNSKSGKITLTLMNTSTANALLSALSLIDRTAKHGAGVGPSAIADLNGATLYTAGKSWIEGRPKASWGREATHREWTIEFSNGESFESGT